jgi:hypothetical protein
LIDNSYSKVNCAHSEWGSCNSGYQTRSITTNPSGGGDICGSLRQSCTPPPKSNCEVGSWGVCVRDSQGRTGTKTRSVTKAAVSGGESCPSLSEKCEPDIDCKMGDWDPCVNNAGSYKKYRTIKEEKQGGGAECPSKSTEELCKFSIKNDNKCINLEEATNKQNVKLKDCDSTHKQMWSFDNNKLRSLHTDRGDKNACLKWASGGVGPKPYISNCDDTETQWMKWDTSDNKLKGTNGCADVDNDGLIYSNDCISGRASQNYFFIEK